MDTTGSVKFTDLKKLVADHFKNGLSIDRFVIHLCRACRNCELMESRR